MDMKFEEVNSYHEWEIILEGFHKNIFSLRDRYVPIFGFPIITKELLENLVEVLKGKSVVDIGCGPGYLSYHLKNNGINIRAIDKDIEENKYHFKKNCFTDSIEKVNFLELDSYDYDVFIISWPNYEETDIELLLDLIPKNSLVIYQGENYGGCCADDGFFDKLENEFIKWTNMTDKLNEHHLRFECIRDYWYCYKKL